MRSPPRRWAPRRCCHKWMRRSRSSCAVVFAAALHQGRRRQRCLSPPPSVKKHKWFVFLRLCGLVHLRFASRPGPRRTRTDAHEVSRLLPHFTTTKRATDHVPAVGGGGLIAATQYLVTYKLSIKDKCRKVRPIPKQVIKCFVPATMSLVRALQSFDPLQPLPATASAVPSTAGWTAALAPGRSAARARWPS